MSSIGEGGGGIRGGGGRGGGGCTYWLVASSLRDGQTTESLHSGVRTALLNPRSPLCEDVGLLDVPLNLKFGSFDDLIRAVDTLQKYDHIIEGILRRIEKQTKELDNIENNNNNINNNNINNNNINNNKEFKIIWQRHSLSIEQYIRRFTWDDSKYPKQRAIRENIEAIIININKIDDELRGKLAVYQEIRQQVKNTSADTALLTTNTNIPAAAAAAAAAAGANYNNNISYAQIDLIDVLTPSVVEDGDFIDTEHLRTLVLCINKEEEEKFMNIYERINSNIVPRSAKKFMNINTDKDGYNIWRIIILRKGINNIKEDIEKNKEIKKKIIIKDNFIYNKEYYNIINKERIKILTEEKKHLSFLIKISYAAYSDIFIAYVHLKIIRIFTESLLRYGLPPNFISFFIKPFYPIQHKQIHKILFNLLMPQQLFGNRFYNNNNNNYNYNNYNYNKGGAGGGAGGGGAGGGGGEGGAGNYIEGGTGEGADDFFPYVLIPLQPFAS